MIKNINIEKIIDEINDYICGTYTFLDEDEDIRYVLYTTQEEWLKSPTNSDGATEEEQKEMDKIIYDGAKKIYDKIQNKYNRKEEKSNG